MRMIPRVKDLTQFKQIHVVRWQSVEEEGIFYVRALQPCGLREVD